MGVFKAVYDVFFQPFETLVSYIVSYARYVTLKLAVKTVVT